MRRTFKAYLLITLKGMGMGAADVVPGVSGGTIAFISGIYEELINSIKSINGPAFKKLLQRAWNSFWHTINGNFLVALFLGIFISVLSLSKVLHYALVHEPVLIWSFFFGLIIASAIYVSRKVTKWNLGTISILLFGIIIAYIITSLTPAHTSEAPWFIFLSGALAVCAMVLPGISGSFILLLLGKYQFILQAVNEMNITILGIVIVGAMVGLLSFANLLSYLLRKYHNGTIAILSGFMVGSLNKVWPWKVADLNQGHAENTLSLGKNILPGEYEQLINTDPQLYSGIICFIVGFSLIFIIERVSKAKTKTV